MILLVWLLLHYCSAHVSPWDILYFTACEHTYIHTQRWLTVTCMAALLAWPCVGHAGYVMTGPGQRVVVEVGGLVQHCSQCCDGFPVDGGGLPLSLGAYQTVMARPGLGLSSVHGRRLRRRTVILEREGGDHHVNCSFGSTLSTCCGRASSGSWDHPSQHVVSLLHC